MSIKQEARIRIQQMNEKNILWSHIFLDLIDYLF